MTIRDITEHDITHITDICIKGMEFDSFTPDLVREKTTGARDHDPHLGLVYEKDGEVAGFLQAAVGKRNNNPHGWIRLLVVNPVHRRCGVGTALIAEIEHRIADRDVRTLTVMDAVPNYLTPGVDFRYTEGYCFLERNGYERVGQAIDLVCEVSPGKFKVSEDVERLKTEGFDIKRATPGDMESVMAFMRRDFESWEDEVRESFMNNPISLHICVYENKVVGFSAYDTNNKNTGWFGPMGVTPITRGKGIGGILCKLCLRDIALQGHRKSIIPWVGPVYFYSRICDARLDRIFWIWQKKIA